MARLAALVLAMLLGETAAGAGAGSADEIEPFAARFQAEWKGISVAVSDLELRRDAQPGRYIYTWRISARGLFRLVYSDDVVQESWFSFDGGRVRPNRYEGREGAALVRLDFDWDGGRARGVAEGKPLDLALEAGTQDVLSIQIEVMRDLKSGALPPDFRIIDKDEVKDFLYKRMGTERIDTALGRLDAIVVTSQRTGSNRVLRMWFAPDLGFVPVKAERTRDGKPEFTMRIKTLHR